MKARRILQIGIVLRHSAFTIAALVVLSSCATTKRGENLPDTLKLIPVSDADVNPRASAVADSDVARMNHQMLQDYERANFADSLHYVFYYSKKVIVGGTVVRGTRLGGGFYIYVSKVDFIIDHRIYTE